MEGRECVWSRRWLVRDRYAGTTIHSKLLYDFSAGAVAVANRQTVRTGFRDNDQERNVTILPPQPADIRSVRRGGTRHFLGRLKQGTFCFVTILRMVRSGTSGNDEVIGGGAKHVVHRDDDVTVDNRVIALEKKIRVRRRAISTGKSGGCHLDMSMSAETQISR